MCIMKICTKCRQGKSLDGFHKTKRSIDGLRAVCKQCRSKIHRAYYLKNKESVAKRTKKYKKAHIDEFREYQREYRRERRKVDPEYAERLKALDCQSYKKHAEKRKAISRAYSKLEKTKLRAKVWNKTQYQKNKRNPIWRLERNVKRAVWDALKKGKQNRRTFGMLRYTAEELKDHLEAQFTEGMTWANYGKWHVDHIIPISFFQYNSANDVEFKMCWRLENLQPLWAKDNLAKRDKLKIAS